MSMPSRNFGNRGTTMAVACVAVIGGALATMYGVKRDVKRKEGAASPYKQGEGLRPGGSDVKMTGSDVAAAVSMPKPGKERLPTTGKSE